MGLLIWKDNIKNGIVLFMKSLLFIISGSFAGFCLLLAVYALPVENISLHVKQSETVFEEEGMIPAFLPDILINVNWSNLHSLKALLLNNRITMRDGVTDHLMLANAAYDGDESLLDKTLNVYHYSNDEKSNVESYARYWHGYLVVLKPLLELFTYKQIRIINIIIMAFLSGWLLLEIKKRLGKKELCVFLFALCFFMPFTVPICLQYCTVTYTVLFFSIILFNKYEYFTKHKLWGNFFIFAGMVTSYVDFLTFPLVTLGIPLIFLYLLDELNTGFGIKRMVYYCVMWCEGYLGCWAMKWVLATVIIKENVISDAINQIIFRTSSIDAEATEIGLLYALGKNLLNYSNIVYIALVVPGILFLVTRIVKEKINCWLMLKQRYVLLIIACFPLVWYIVIRNHSWIHDYFTCRSLFITVYAGVSFLYPRIQQ